MSEETTDAVRRTLIRAYRRQQKLYAAMRDVTRQQLTALKGGRPLEEFAQFNNQKVSKTRQIQKIERQVHPLLARLKAADKTSSPTSRDLDGIIRELVSTVTDMLSMERKCRDLLQRRLATTGKELRELGLARSLRKLVTDTKRPLPRFVEIST